METVKVSSKYQIVIPKEIREAMDIKPGERFMVVQSGKDIRLMPDKPITAMRGRFQGIDTTVEREEDRF